MLAESVDSLGLPGYVRVVGTYLDDGDPVAVVFPRRRQVQVRDA